MAAAPVPFLAELNLPAGIAVLLAPLPAVATVEDVTEEVFEGRLQYYEALRKINDVTHVQLAPAMLQLFKCGVARGGAPALDMHAALLQIQGTLLEMLAAMQTLGHQLRVISNNSIARVNNGHAQQGNSALAPIEIEAPEHIGQIPEDFPATVDAANSLTNQRLTTLSALYGVVWPGPLAARRRSFRRFVGMSQG